MADRGAPTTGSGVTRYVLGAIALGVVFVVLAVQNSETTPVDVLFWHATPPLCGIAVISALFGAAAAEITAGIWRHRRRVHDRERFELRRLRRGSAPAT